MSTGFGTIDHAIEQIKEEREETERTEVTIYLNRQSIGAYPGTDPYWLSWDDRAVNSWDSVVESVSVAATVPVGYDLDKNHRDDLMLFGPSGAGLTAVEALRQHIAVIDPAEFVPGDGPRYLQASDLQHVGYARLLRHDRE